jgi:branched-chain amino acid transport system substrate-binding protein
MEISGQIHRISIFAAGTMGILGVIFAIWSAVWDNEDDFKAVTVVVSVPLRLSIGESIANSVKLAFEEVGYRANETQLSLRILDDGDENGAWKVELEKANAEEAAADPSVVAYIGTYNSGAAKISMPILNRAGIIQISPANTWPGLTKPGFLPGEPGIFYPAGARHYVRVCPTDDLQGPAGALWAKKLGFSSVFVVDDGEAYGSGIGALFSSRAQESGLSVVGASTLQPSPESVETVMQMIKEAQPSLVYYAGITPNGGPDLLRRLREEEIDIAFMGPDGILETDFINRAGKGVAEGVYATTVGVPTIALPGEKADLFRTAYINRFGKEPEVFGAFAYTAAQVLLSAIQSVPRVDRFTILAQVKSTTDFDSMFGKFSFDQNGDTTITLMSGNIVEGGLFRFVEQLPVPF